MKRALLLGVVLFLIIACTTVIEEVKEPVEQPTQPEPTTTPTPIPKPTPEPTPEPVIPDAPETEEPAEPKIEEADIKDLIDLLQEQNQSEKKFKLGVTLTAKNGRWDINSNEPYKTAKRMGMTINQEYFNWTELEQAPGDYRWDAIDSVMRKNQFYGLKVALIIRLIDPNSGTISEAPGGVHFESFNDQQPRVLLSNLINAMYEAYPDTLEYVFIGYKMDRYYHNPSHHHPDYLESFLDFLYDIQQGVDEKIKIGTILQFDEINSGTKKNIPKKIGELVDVLGYIYHDDTTRMLSFSNQRIIEDFNKMEELGQFGPIAIIETAYSVDPKHEGSVELQEEWAEAILTEYKFRDHIEYISWFTLFDDVNNPKHINRMKGLISAGGSTYRPAYNLWARN